MTVYNKIFTKILDSSIWLEPSSTRLVWLTFIAAMDEDGFVQFASISNLAHRARVPLNEVEEAVKCLESPDANSSDPDNEGRRVERVPGGWMILNAGKYRDMVTRAVSRERTRLRVAKHRQGKADSNGAVTPCNADVTASNESVTQSGAVSKAEADSFLSEKKIVEKRKKRTDALDCHEFDKFYQLYPHKKSKAHAEKMWVANDCASKAVEIMQALRAQVPEILSREPKFRPHPGTWLNERRWEDEDAAPMLAAVPAPVAKRKTRHDFIKAWETKHNHDYLNYPHDEHNKPIPAYILGEADYKAYLAEQNGQ